MGRAQHLCDDRRAVAKQQKNRLRLEFRIRFQMEVSSCLEITRVLLHKPDVVTLIPLHKPGGNLGAENQFEPFTRLERTQACDERPDGHRTVACTTLCTCAAR